MMAGSTPLLFGVSEGLLLLATGLMILTHLLLFASLSAEWFFLAYPGGNEKLHF